MGWLAGRPEVAGYGVGVLGASRGGEAALLVGTRLPTIRAVVGVSASPVVWGGQGARPAWSQGGVGLPYVPFLRREQAGLVRTGQAVASGERGAPVALRHRFERRLQDGRGHPETRLAIEETRGPILLVSGEEDMVWPSTPMAEEAMARLAGAGRRLPDRHLRYPGAGHGIGRPPGLPGLPTTAVHPVTGARHDLGGTREANARANRDAWPSIVSFLAEHLG